VDRAHLEGISLNTLVVELLSEARGALGAGDRATERLDAIIRRVESMVTGSNIGC
jgi:hypothetical protein